MLLQEAAQKKSKRGRKPVEDDIYIKQSIEKIAEWERQLDEEKDKMSDKEYKLLYSKKSALQSRVKRKQEQMWQKSSANDFKVKAEGLAKIIEEEIPQDSFDYFMEQLKIKNWQKLTPSKGTPKTRSLDFVKKLAEFIAQK